MTKTTRYERQTALKELGEQGQQQLLQAKVLVIGAGGLGCPILQYLTAAGVGEIGIADDDVVALNNLHRQILYTENHVGKLKVEAAADVLQRMNSTVKINQHIVRLDNKNILPIIRLYDVVVDATDNIPTRYMVNDACYLLSKPMVYGSILRFEGQLAVFNYNTNITYRDLFPQQPKENEIADCNEAGVIGVLPGIIGSLQAAETIKIITGIGQVASGKLLTYNMLHNSLYEFNISANPSAASFLPADEKAFEHADYGEVCDVFTVREIDISSFDKIRNLPDTIVVDVREEYELSETPALESIQMPFSVFDENIELPNSDTIVVVCKSGHRSKAAAALLSRKYKNVVSLHGGINNWLTLNKMDDA
ncbi:HesA/MoeB/ThiF family protein [Chitinophagaceae bacterium 26-R-25]|nr:HesA/MoeB/ThiF family protein [Chitinophagaceae bacterium 26-R-25]